GTRRSHRVVGLVSRPPALRQRTARGLRTRLRAARAVRLGDGQHPRRDSLPAHAGRLAISPDGARPFCPRARRVPGCLSGGFVYVSGQSGFPLPEEKRMRLFHDIHRLRTAIIPLMAACIPALAATYPPGFVEQILSDDLISPSGLVVASDGRVFFGEQKGQIRVVTRDSLPPALLIDLQEKTDYNTERGLMGIALDTGFADSGFLYVYYTARAPYSHNRLSRFFVRLDSTAATTADTA